MAVLVDLAVSPTKEIDPRGHRSLKVGVGRIHTGVDDGHHHALSLCHAPGLLHTDLLEHRRGGCEQ